MISRRTLLKSGAASGLLAGLSSRTKLAFAAEESTGGGTVIFLFLRGGMDGLNFVAPADDPNLVAARPQELRPATSGDEAGWALAGAPTNADWRLNFHAPALRDVYNSGQLAFVHATGLSYLDRSHFQVQQLAERGISDPALADAYPGWIGRYAALGGVTDSTFSVVWTPSDPPLSAQSDPTALGINSASSFRLSSDTKRRFLAAAYDAGTGPLSTMAAATLSGVTQFKTLNTSYVNANQALYGGDEFSKQLQILAELIKTGAGLQVAETEYDGWDDHGGEADRFPPHLATFSAALGAFWEDLTRSGFAKNVTIVAFSEFGRRVQSNASGGTDHGHGGLGLILGGNVKGGKIYGSWPGLAPANLIDGDLQVTTDYRALLLETLNAVRGPLPASFFPGLPAYKPLGLFPSSSLS